METKRLTERAMLVSLNISQWTARKHDREISDEVAREHGTRRPSDDVGRYNKILVDKAALRPIQEVVTEARTHHDKVTLPWSDQGYRILTAAGYFDYTQAMSGFQSRFVAAVDAFAVEYRQHVAEARDRLNGMFNADDYPDEWAIRAKFEFTHQVMPLPDEGDFRVSSLGADDVDKIKADIRARIDAEVQEAVRDPWNRIHDAVQHMAGRLHAFNPTGKGKDRGAFRDSLVDNLRELVDVLPALNLSGDGELDAMRDRLAADLCDLDAQDLRDDMHAREETARKADAILASMAGYGEAAA